MKIGHQTKFTVINGHANSVYSLIADGHYRATSLGRNTWKTLIGSQASLQLNCNKEGFNAVYTELVSLGTTETLATAVTPESGLVQQDILMTLTREGT